MFPVKFFNKHDATVKFNDLDVSPSFEIWKLKKLIKFLEGARGDGSLVSLIVPPCANVTFMTDKLDFHYEARCKHIRRKLERLGKTVTDFDMSRDPVLGAIKFAQQTMESYGTIPLNGLVLYAGGIVTDDGEEKEFAIEFEPFSPVKSFVPIFGDDEFHTKALTQLIECNNRVGFIIVDANGVLFATMRGDTRDILYELDFSVDQSPTSRLRKAAELATLFYINPKTSKPNVLGLILAGPDDFKRQLIDSNMFDPRLSSMILEVTYVYYGGEVGFNQAIECSGVLFEIELTQEKKLIEKCLKKYKERTFVFGVANTLKVLNMGVVETLVVWEDLCVTRYVLKNVCTGEIIIKHLTKEQEADQSSLFTDHKTGAELEVQEMRPLIEWFADEYKRFGCTLEFATNKSELVSDFCGVFAGMGALLRHPVDIRSS